MAKEFKLPFSELKATLNDTPIEPTLEITENGVYNVKGYVYADVNVEGGESDFSTVEVTITDTSEIIDGSFMLLGNNIYEDFMYSYLFKSDIDGSSVTFVTYKGTALITLYLEDVRLSDLNIVVTGDVVFNSEALTFTVTGNGTITISSSVV